MSYLQLIFTSIKETEKKFNHLPSQYFFIPTIVIAIAVSVILFYSNPFWYTWTIESTIATITMASLAFWAVGVLLVFSFTGTILFFITLYQQRRKELEENAIIISTNMRPIIHEEFENIMKEYGMIPNNPTKKAFTEIYEKLEKTVPLEEYVKLSERLLKAEDEIIKLKENKND